MGRQRPVVTVCRRPKSCTLLCMMFWISKLLQIGKRFGLKHGFYDIQPIQISLWLYEGRRVIRLWRQFGKGRELVFCQFLWRDVTIGGWGQFYAKSRAKFVDDPIRSHITQNDVPMSHGLLNDYGTVVTISSVANFDILLTLHLSIFISVINQLDARNFCFTIRLFRTSTCFEHLCSSSGQNCITQPLVSSHL